MEGYAKRFAASYADSFDGNMLGGAVFPILLRQDPRYFPKGSGTFTRRLIHAVGSIVRCKGDNGRWQPNFSYLMGNFGSRRNFQCLLSSQRPWRWAYVPTRDGRNGRRWYRRGPVRILARHFAEIESEAPKFTQ